jgi:predicted N-acyltransferase
MEVKLINSISDVEAVCWNELAGSETPFLRHEFLRALEQSGSVSERTGWIPQHLLIYSDDQLIALMPLYLKFHSRGEYVFDHEWAHAYERNGFAYYPKWVTSIPFTPCQGARIAIQEGLNELEVMQHILSFLKEKSDYYNTSSWHCLFPTAQQAGILGKLGLSIRQDIQYHWFNRGYRDFPDYLEIFNARNRKKINRERRRIREQGIEFRQLTGPEISEAQWQVFFQFYNMTYFKRGLQAYLNFDFFSQIAESMADSLMLVFAIKNNRYVGAALSFAGKDTLYGRYWGCHEEYKSLHFETCYYQGLDYCIAKGLKRFDSGAQGEHKITRGFEPVSTSSAHWIKDPRFAEAIDRFLGNESGRIKEYKRYTESLLPFKQAQ